jgi:glycine/D-amino acid oxidase-like deaminating enzyme
MRPLTPEGLPVLGPVPGRPGLHVATGHSMLGVTLAATTGELLAPVVLDGGPSLALAPFSVARFGNRAP